MLPFKSTPVYRHGAETPWGGDALATVFGKPIPDTATGESLEVSALSGLESLDPDGVPFGARWQAGGEAFRGTQVGGTCPLLLKLIHARESLSVQVHPNDAYAAAHAPGKLGKTEAWVILHAQPGARIIYGTQPGLTVRQLRDAARAGAALEGCLRSVPVQAGDAFFIPAGMVHAIGAGILLYEVQQSSDLTYRLWDWGRRDAAGNPRALHLHDALAVMDPALQLSPCAGEERRSTGGRRTRLVCCDAFTLDRLQVQGSMPLEVSPQRFRLLTALCAGWLAYPGGALAFSPGDSVFIPAGSPRIKLECEGDLLLAAPGRAGWR
ncbi:MAG: class I mannose-6-phosphate isomerase [Oscillospiraceae bacterium]|jgi:mannose-6-phosphate isomerase|nr:class I mannose-6-phosphate isomerase [Oscillospiraceae bacterium]